MAIDKTRALPPKTLRDDFESFNALKAVAGYSPANAAFTLANGTALRNAMDAADAKAAQDRAQAAASRDNAVAAQWAFHDYVTGSKTQVRAQFGDSSNEIQAMGLKKKSEYKSPSKKAKDSTP